MGKLGYNPNSRQYKKYEMRKMGIQSDAEFMFAMCSNPDKKLLCGTHSRSLDKITCTIDCFTINNPDILKAQQNPGSLEEKQMYEKIRKQLAALHKEKLG